MAIAKKIPNHVLGIFNREYIPIELTASIFVNPIHWYSKGHTTPSKNGNTLIKQRIDVASNFIHCFSFSNGSHDQPTYGQHKELSVNLVPTKFDSNVRSKIFVMWTHVCRTIDWFTYCFTIEPSIYLHTFKHPIPNHCGNSKDIIDYQVC